MAIGFCFSFSLVEEGMFDAKYEKKIFKQIEKTFGKENYTLTQIKNDSLLLKNKELFQIYVHENLKGYLMLSFANACKKNGCEANYSTEEDVYDDFYFLTIYDASKTIKNVKVLEYNSINGYQITAASWLKQFMGKIGGNLQVNQDVDAISGATISVNSMVSEINSQQKWVN